ncbi:MAG: hypothetical protein WC477_07030 [Patescibacteria group bacterium]
MSNSILTSAERVISLFELKPFIQMHSDNLREKLFANWHLASSPQEFIDRSLTLASSVVQVGTPSMLIYKTAIGKLSSEFLLDSVQMNVRVSHHVLFFILYEAVHNPDTKCVNDTEAWCNMEAAARAILFDPVEIDADMNRLVRHVLKLESYIDEKSEIISTRLTEAHLMSMAAESSERAFNTMVHLSSGLVLNGTVMESLREAIADIKSRTSKDPTTIVTLYVLLFITLTFAQQPLLTDACSYFKERTLEQLAVCF